jgi:hypothetical protein
MKSLTIGHLARESGMNLETVRYYERRGLLPKPPRSASRYRLFPIEAAQRLRFIQRAKGVESLLSNDFVFTGPHDYRIDRETYANGAGYSEKCPIYGIEKLFEKGNEAFIPYDRKAKHGGSSRNTEFFTIKGNEINEIEVYFGSTPKGTS